MRTRRGTYPFKHNLLTAYRARKWKEPEPLIDVFEENDRITVVAQFAGFKRENLKIHVKDQRLILSAETSDRKYYKSLNLPKRVNLENLHTSYKNGVLEIQFERTVKEKTINKVAG